MLVYVTKKYIEKMVILTFLHQVQVYVTKELRVLTQIGHRPLQAFGEGQFLKLFQFEAVDKTKNPV